MQRVQQAQQVQPDLLVLLVRGIITVQHLQLAQALVKLGLIQIQAEFLSFMMDTGLKQEPRQLVQQVLSVLQVQQVQLVRQVHKDQQERRAPVKSVFHGG